MRGQSPGPEKQEQRGGDGDGAAPATIGTVGNRLHSPAMTLSGPEQSIRLSVTHSRKWPFCSGLCSPNPDPDRTHRLEAPPPCG